MVISVACDAYKQTNNNVFLPALYVCPGLYPLLKLFIKAEVVSDVRWANRAPKSIVYAYSRCARTAREHHPFLVNLHTFIVILPRGAARPCTMTVKK